MLFATLRPPSHEVRHGYFQIPSDMNMSSSLRRDDLHQCGFTLVELITIMVIVGILAVAAVPRFFDRNTFDSRGFHDQVISTVRYAQKAAIAQHRFVCVTFAAHSITMTWGATAACTGGSLPTPAGNTSISNDNVLITAPSAGNISFDCLGRPRLAGNALATCEPGNIVDVLAGDQTVGIQDAADITIVRETGYVH